MSLLEVKDLNVRYYTPGGVVYAANDISYTIDKGERFGVVGESGAGKSVSARAILRLISSPGQIESGEILFKGENLLELSEEEMRSKRGNEIAMVFQDAQTALNPVYTVGEQVAEPIREHLGYSKQRAKERAIEMLDKVGIPDPGERYTNYPHEFSGGMQQRAVIATALACEPELLICDEPTTALDVTIEAQILELLEGLSNEFDTAIQFITHDLGVVAEICDRAMVMYAGKPVEKGSIEELFYDPKHPYTVGLMTSIPRIGRKQEKLNIIPGTMPDLIQFPSGCDFHPRCPYAEEICGREEPSLIPTDGRENNEEVNEDVHVASCLEYADKLTHGLDYTVTVKEL